MTAIAVTRVHESNNRCERLHGRAAVLLVALGFGFGGCTSERPPSTASSVRVAAAADLTQAFQELGSAFERETGQPVAFSFGSTGLLAKQLREGAPFDVFAAAHVSFVDEVVTAGACIGTTKARYGRGRIVLWTKGDSIAPPAALNDLADARFARVAIAHPEHAPYGKAAKQALEGAGIWGAVEPKLVLAENVRQTLQFVESGNVEVALVALALVAQDHDNPWLLIDETLHQPIDQALVICTRGENRAGGRAFTRFLQSEPGRTIMRRHGFIQPAERPIDSP